MSEQNYFTGHHLSIDKSSRNFINKKGSMGLPFINKYKRDMMPSIYSVGNNNIF
jgi:hypothetical protein